MEMGTGVEDERQTRTGTETRAVVEMATGAGTGTGSKMGNKSRMEREGGGRTRALVSATAISGKKSRIKIRHCHSARGIIPLDRRWYLQVASFSCTTRRLHDDVVPREEQGTTDGNEKAVTGTGTGVGSGTRTRTEMSTRLEGRMDEGDNGSGNGDDNEAEGGGERRDGNLRSGKVCRKTRGGGGDANE